MSFISSLFGGAEGDILPMLFALGVVIVLIVLAVWLLKFVFNVSTGVTRGRNRRLAVVDTLALDTKRQLVIVRRDNVEHLILTGGSHDLVVETNIPVDEAPSQTGRRIAPTARPPRPLPVKPAPTPATESGQKSLRQTALLRPMSKEEPGQNADISPVPVFDSAKEGPADEAKRDDTVEQHPTGEVTRG